MRSRNVCLMKSGQASTVARYIQRFREASPVSPRRRHRQRALVIEEFWWNRSKLENESPGNSSKDSSPDSTSSKADGDEKPYAGNDELDLVDEGSSLDSNFLGAKESKQTFQQSLVRSIPSHSVSNVGGVLPGGPRVVDEPPIISTDHAVRHPSIEYGPCQVKPASPEMRQDHVIVDEPVAEELGPDLYGRAQQQDLDVRASAVLERCRRLLEVPTTADVTLLHSATDENEIDRVDSLWGVEGPRQGLERRKWELSCNLPRSVARTPLECDTWRGEKDWRDSVCAEAIGLGKHDVLNVSHRRSLWQGSSRGREMHDPLGPYILPVHHMDREMGRMTVSKQSGGNTIIHTDHSERYCAEEGVNTLPPDRSMYRSRPPLKATDLVSKWRSSSCTSMANLDPVPRAEFDGNTIAEHDPGCDAGMVGPYRSVPLWTELDNVKDFAEDPVVEELHRRIHAIRMEISRRHIGVVSAGSNL